MMMREILEFSAELFMYFLGVERSRIHIGNRNVSVWMSLHYL